MAETVLCVVPALEHAHYSRRVAMLRDAGFRVSVVGFERAGRPGGRLEGPVESLGPLARGRYLKRGLVLGASVRRVRAALRRHDLAYAFGPDLGALALLAGRRTGIPVVVEIPDLRPRQTASGGLGRIARALDRALVERCRLLVLTSPDYETYYRTWLRTGTPRLVIENKVDPAIAAAFGEPDAGDPRAEPPEPLPDRPLRLGWFGLLRDDWSLRLLEALGRAAPGRFEFSLAGAFAPVVPDFARRVSGVPDLVYHGPFRREEAPALFAGVDLTLSCYPPDPPHWRWSRSNRYYLACLCRTPLITRAGTADAAETERWDLGVSLREETPECAAAALTRRFASRRAARDDLRRFRANMAGLPRDHYVATEEPGRLRRALAAARGGGSGEG